MAPSAVSSSLEEGGAGSCGQELWLHPWGQAWEDAPASLGLLSGPRAVGTIAVRPGLGLVTAAQPQQHPLCRQCG